MRMLVNIDVPQLAPAIDFYCRALGLTLERILDEDVAELGGASCLIYLLANTSGSAASKTSGAVRRYARHWTPVHLDFVVDDIDAWARRVTGAGAQQESDCVAWRGSKCMTFADPFGHGFCLIEFSDEAYR